MFPRQEAYAPPPGSLRSPARKPTFPRQEAYVPALSGYLPPPGNLCSRRNRDSLGLVSTKECDTRSDCAVAMLNA